MEAYHLSPIVIIGLSICKNRELAHKRNASRGRNLNSVPKQLSLYYG